MEQERRRPFFVTLLCIQYGIAGLGYLTAVLYVLSAIVGAGNFGLSVLTNTFLLWIAILLIGIYLFAAAKGLYDLKGYGWTLALIGSALWLAVSAIIFLGAVFIFDQSIQMAQPPDVGPMVRGMLVGMPSDVVNMAVSAAQGLASALMVAVVSVYYLIKGFFLSNAIYNGIVVVYLVRVRPLFRKPQAKPQPEVSPLGGVGIPLPAP